MLVPYIRRNHAMWDPFRDWDALERSLFRDTAPEAFRTDIRDEGDSYVLEADLPGFRKEDIRVDLDDNTLTVTAERHSDYEKKDEQNRYVRCERAYGAFSRSFDTAGIDTEQISAAYTDGVLTLTLPKLTETPAKTRRLEIR